MAFAMFWEICMLGTWMCSIITIVLLNGIHDPEVVEQRWCLSSAKELQEATVQEKNIGKDRKTGKEKKEKKYSAETLNDLR